MIVIIVNTLLAIYSCDTLYSSYSIRFDRIKTTCNDIENILWLMYLLFIRINIYRHMRWDLIGMTFVKLFGVCINLDISECVVVLLRFHPLFVLHQLHKHKISNWSKWSHIILQAANWMRLIFEQNKAAQNDKSINHTMNLAIDIMLACAFETSLNRLGSFLAARRTNISLTRALW